MYKSYSNKDVIKLEETYEVDKKHFSMFINDGNDNYTEYNESNMFPDGYVINIDKSKCTDNKGNIIEGILSKSGSSVTVTSNKTAYCYLYFDTKETLYELCSRYSNIDSCSKSEELSNAKDIWNSPLEDDGYRYVGTNPDNHICFGTADKNECINDTDKYMYRIIGIFEDSEGKQHLKLIKKEALNTKYAWHSDNTVDIDWNSSDLYNGINGSYFLTNATYSYMQDTNWTNKIEEWNYTATNTLTSENSGPNYYNNITVKSIYLHEMNRDGKTNTSGDWKTISTKIGLMYVSDYLLSLGSSVLSYTSYTNRTILKTGWMHLSNNDSGAPSTSEMTMTRNGAYSDGNYRAWYVDSEGLVGRIGVHNTHSVRPVFYLTTDIKLDSGNGTSDNPYIIKSTKTDTEKLIDNVSSDVLWESTLEDDGYRFVGTDPSNYICFGTTDTSTCTSDTDLYMYRIIGIFEDSEGKQHLKLIKKEALNTARKWNNTESDVDWDESTLYESINGSFFASSTDYAYMQDTNWTDKIAIWNYIATNTKSQENYETNSIYGIDYTYNIVATIYLHEMNRNSKISQTCYYNSSTVADCSVGEWKNVNAKIGIMYASDYLLSLGDSVLNYTNNNSTHYEIMKTGWMHITNNDSASLSTSEEDPPSQAEWTMSRIGVFGNNYHRIYLLNSSGYISYNNVDSTRAIRPVFYLTSDVTITGEGTLTSPYIIS